MQQTKISVIIVNYNVREFLEQALLSLNRALNSIDSEIIVVDNASVDGSVQMLLQRFPDVHLIENDQNVGFSAANNQAIEIAEGEYIVLLNPDTVVQEDTFTSLLSFFNKTPDAAAATCKIINPDGSFSVDCRHSIPTPMTAFWKVTGLSGFFPKSKLFGRYNLTFMDENETYPVEAISGSFMMIKNETIDKIGLLDERFFMYCEDIDYCHRINLSGGKIYYVPDSQIIHYKGESTKKNNLDYIVTFNRSLYEFYKKHYQQKYIYPFKWLILLGVVLRGMMIYIKNFISQYYPFLIDFALLNLTLLLSFYIRLELKDGFDMDDFLRQGIVINLFASISFTLSSLFFDNVSRNQHSVSRIFKANFATYTSIAALTFFLKQFAFSRLVVLIAAVLGTVSMAGWRLVLRFFARKAAHTLGKDFFLKRTLLVGTEEEISHLVARLERRINTGMDIQGVVTISSDKIGQDISGVPVLTSLDRLDEYLRIKKINLVIFSTHNLSYERILNTMARVNRKNIEFKMVPGHFEFMIGKSVIERLDSVPLVDIEYAYGKPFNRFLKRIFDTVVSGLLLILFSPLCIGVIANRNKMEQRQVADQLQLLQFSGKPLLQFYLDLWQVLTGKMSFVGAPVDQPAGLALRHDYKPGITGIVQINQAKQLAEPAIEDLEMYYLKNQNFLLDMEILFRSFFNRKS